VLVGPDTSFSCMCGGFRDSGFFAVKDLDDFLVTARHVGGPVFVEL